MIAWSPDGMFSEHNLVISNHDVFICTVNAGLKFIIKVKNMLLTLIGKSSPKLL